jgi:hypothetical protein
LLNGYGKGGATVGTASAMAMKEELGVAYETKVILISLAEIACRTEARDVYNAIRKMANAEGVILESYEDARAELESQGKPKD